jgi:hypothetical protein
MLPTGWRMWKTKLPMTIDGKDAQKHSRADGAYPGIFPGKYAPHEHKLKMQVSPEN